MRENNFANVDLLVGITKELSEDESRREDPLDTARQYVLGIQRFKACLCITAKIYNLIYFHASVYNMTHVVLISYLQVIIILYTK